jgi:PST family polysaccharide transporter
MSTRQRVSDAARNQPQLRKLTARLANRTNRDLAIVFSGQALRLGLGIVSSSLLARGLGPAGLGVFSVISVWMTIAVTLGDVGVTKSAVRFIAVELLDQPEDALATGRVFTALRMAGALAVAAAILLLATPLARALGLQPLHEGRTLLALAALGVLATSLSSVPATILQALKRFPGLFATQTLNISLTVALVAALFVAGQITVASALVIGILTALAATLLGYRLLPAPWRGTLRIPARPELVGPTARRLLDFGKWLWVSTLLSVVLAQVDLLLVNRYTDPQSAGYYAIALNLSLKVDILNQTLQVVLLPTVAALTTLAQMRGYLQDSLRRSLALTGLLVLVALVARPFILVVYGASYAPAVPLFYLLLVVAAFDLLTLPVLLLACPLDAPKVIAASHLLRVAAMLAASALLIPLWGGTGAAVAKLLAKVLGALFIGIALTILWRRRLSAEHG